MNLRVFSRPTRLCPFLFRPALLGALLSWPFNLAPQTVQAQTITTQTVDSAGDVGTHISHAVVSGKPAISYYDVTNHDLKYAINSAANGSGAWSTTVVDSAGDVGQFTSLAVVNGKPAISYWDVSNTDLKFAINSNSDGSGTWTLTTVEKVVFGDVGQHTSLTVVDDKPAISYRDSTNGDLKFAINTAADGGGTWNTMTVDSTGNVGDDTSLAVVNGKPAISYQDGSNLDLKFAVNSAADGSGTWTTVTVDNTGNVGSATSLATVSGKPAISYRDNTNGDLKFAINSTADGSGTWTKVTVDSLGNVGFYTSLEVVNSKPAISYWDIGNLDLKYAINSAADGSGAWMTTTVESGGEVGEFSSLALVDGKPAIAYRDSTNTNLKWARLGIAAPDALTLSNNKIAEEAGNNAFIGLLKGTDPDASPGETLTYSLPAGVDDNALFAISGNQLRSATNFDYETKSSYLVTVRVTDIDGLFFETPFRILVTPPIYIVTPAANAKILLTSFTPGSITGTTSDNIGVSLVKVRLVRKRGSVNFYWNGTDFVTTQSLVLADVKGSNWSLTTNAPPVAQLDMGLYSVQAAAYDTAGNKSAYAERTFTLFQDQAAPSIAISTPNQNQLMDINAFGAGTISGTASDDTAVTAVKIKLQRKRNNVLEYWNGTDFTPTVTLVDATYSSGKWSYDTPIPANKLDKGGYTVYATAYDAVGNFKTTPSRLFNVTGNVVVPDASNEAADKSAGSS